MTRKWCLSLVVALGAWACVFDKGPGAALGSLPESRDAGTAGRGAGIGAQMGRAGRTGDGPSEAGANAASADASSTAGTSAAGAGGAGARGGSVSGDSGERPSDRDASTPSDSGAGHDSGTGCERQVAVCNPVTNEGCPEVLGMHCAVDPLATLTGYCIFSTAATPSPLGDCLNTGVTESCPPTSSCYDGKCRDLCFCDDGCEAGQCCTEPLEGTGFKICGDC